MGVPTNPHAQNSCLECKICLLIFKCLHQTAPAYLTVMSDPVSASASRSHLRSAARCDLAVPRSRTTTYGQRNLSVSGPSLWNSLPLSVRDPSLTMTQFCTHLKSFLFRRAYYTQHSAFVTVQAVNSCADINLLTYLLNFNSCFTSLKQLPDGATGYRPTWRQRWGTGVRYLPPPVKCLPGHLPPANAHRVTRPQVKSPR